jgi:hypothetical protein
MGFTEQEANDKVGEYVCVITEDEDFLCAGVPAGTQGIVEGVGNLGELEAGIRVMELCWYVNIRFYPPGQPDGVLIQVICKDQYDRPLAAADIAAA